MVCGPKERNVPNRRAISDASAEQLDLWPSGQVRSGGWGRRCDGHGDGGDDCVLLVG